ncbi:MAG: phenylalanine 4-monooxygenase [Fluviicola sp. XM-24bin1]|nr:MAG: phenylalanine 4-monooxygenase [Fluviicola sp. XM-24bin1]
MRAVQKIITALVDFFYPLFKRWLPLKTYRYAVCGGGNLILDIFLYFVFYNYVLHQENLDLGFMVMSAHIAALFIVFPITFLTGFLLNKYIAFGESNLRGRIQLYRYALVVAGAILLNYLLMKLFVDVLGFWATLSKILVTAISVVYSYTLQNRFTFKVVNEEE